MPGVTAQPNVARATARVTAGLFRHPFRITDRGSPLFLGYGAGFLAAPAPLRWGSRPAHAKAAIFHTPPS